MEILLLNLPNNGSSSGFRGVFYPLGIGYIAAALKQAGHEVRVYDLQYEKVIGRYGDQRVEEIIRSNHYDALCAGGVFFSLDSLIAITRTSKNIRPEASVIAGGSFCTSIPQVVFSNVSIDFLVIGEGETTIVHLIQEIDSSKSYGSVPGIMYRDIFGGIVQTTPRVPELELDTIAFPDRSILPFNGLYRKHFAIPNPLRYCAFVIASRGCSFSCTFCEPTFGKKVRVRSPENILEEVRMLQTDHNAQYIRFHDELMLGGARKYIIRFCEEVLRTGDRFFWGGTTNANLLNYDTLKLMRRANCFSVSFGVESGSPTILKEMKKRNDLDHLRDVVKWCSELGIEVNFSLISGTPSETPETLKETCDYLLDLNEYYWRIPNEINHIVPIPGSDLYDEAKDRGLITISDFEYILDMQDMSRFQKSLNLTSMDRDRHVQLLKDINAEIRTDYFLKHPRQLIRDRLHFTGNSFKTFLVDFRLRNLKPAIQSISWSISKGQNTFFGRLFQRVTFGRYYSPNSQLDRPNANAPNEPRSMIGMNQF